MNPLFLGLISGTSRDGIDVVVADFEAHDCQLLANAEIAYSDDVAVSLQALVDHPDQVAIAQIGALHAEIGEQFADAALQVLNQSGIDPERVSAIGSHGQTIWHAPDSHPGFSLQIGDPARIAARTGRLTIADFRSGDIAVGGQGAPLVPPFHRWLFGRDGKRRAIVNIGGIANITVVDGESTALSGYDTGPGNGLMNAWTVKHKQQAFDRDGAWAASAEPDSKLLEEMLADPYFARTGPRSTGFEYFNRQWIESFAADNPGRVQATLLNLTVETIARSCEAEKVSEVLVCGGGARNPVLMDGLAQRLDDITVRTTTDAGLHADYIEATAFAWLARERLAGRPGNVPEVTGASRAVPLGAIYLP